VFSTSLELAGFAAITGGAYELAGRGVALLVAGLTLLFLGQAVDGLRPVQAVWKWSVGLRVRWKARWAEKPSKNALPSDLVGSR
jgi:hypothetical protein